MKVQTERDFERNGIWIQIDTHGDLHVKRFLSYAELNASDWERAIDYTVDSMVEQLLEREHDLSRI